MQVGERALGSQEYSYRAQPPSLVTLKLKSPLTQQDINKPGWGPGAGSARGQSRRTPSSLAWGLPPHVHGRPTALAPPPGPPGTPTAQPLSVVIHVPTAEQAQANLTELKGTI